MKERKITPIYRSIVRSDSPKKRIAAYCRVSSDKDEQLHSLAAQIEYYKNALSTDTSCEFVGIYADEGISGTQAAKREEFMRMIDDCRSGNIDGIITKSVSRFGRNTVDTLQYTRELRILGIDVYFEKETIHSIDPEGELMLTLIAAMAQNESVGMSDAIKWGLHRTYEKGSAESLPLGKFYGYSQKNHVITINEAEAEIVRRIYHEFLDGFNAAQIIAGLKADCIPTERGKEKWGWSVILRILQNEKYKGDTLFQKTYISDPISHKREKNNGELPQFYVKNCFLPIVERETWDLVAAEFIRQRAYCDEHHITRYASSSPERPFSGRIVCSVCGHTYIQLVSKIKGDEGRSYWRCCSFLGQNGTPIERMEFVPRGQPLRDVNPECKWVKNYRKHHRKLPEPRQMLCTDIEVDAGKPEKAFGHAWNLLVSKKQLYQAALTRTADITDDLLLRYRTGELLRLIDKVGTIAAFDYELSLKVMEKIEVTTQGKLTVCFFGKIRITV